MTLRQPGRAPATRLSSAALAVLMALGALTLAVDAVPGAAGSSRTLQPPVERDHARPDEGAGAPADAPTVLDEGTPAVSRLDPALLRALRRAAGDAARQGVELRVNSGWRSAEEQAELLREAVDEHGSAEEAARWVATPQTSAHVSGDAVDVGPSAAATWLSRHGARYGLCQTYRNEPWHYELRPEAVADGCPAMYADPTHDPRMQR